MTTSVRESVDTVDEVAIGEFAGRFMGILNDAMLVSMIELGRRTGLFPALAEGPGTSDEIADRAGLNERYVREWLGALVTANIADYDPAAGIYSLPPAAALCLSGRGPIPAPALAQLNILLTRYIEPVAEAFRQGGGVPYTAYRPEFTGLMDSLSRDGYDQLLIPAWLPLAPGVTSRLKSGARVADVACGSGHALVVLARAFPSSRFVGYDQDEQAIARGRAEAANEGLENLIFELHDVASLTVDEPFDVVFVFDAIHDMANPAGVLERIHAALTPGGVFFMKEPRLSSNLEDNIGNPFAPMSYAASTLHCMTVSLAEGGAGLGTAFGEQLARRMLADAGFIDVTVQEAPGDPRSAVFVGTRPLA
jgi:2-polyprenyl-3-methyl-5-hydroxy-6-metoxy-1,4-benzoquinol methylase